MSDSANGNNGPSAMDLLKAAATQFVEELNPGGVMTTAVLLYEVSELDTEPGAQQGDIRYRVRYAVVTDSSMTSAYGTIQLGAEVFSAGCDPRMVDEDD